MPEMRAPHGREASNHDDCGREVDFVELVMNAPEDMIDDLLAALIADALRGM